MKPEICIGTAQFGMNYGITNNKGKIVNGKCVFDNKETDCICKMPSVESMNLFNIQQGIIHQ